MCILGVKKNLNAYKLGEVVAVKINCVNEHGVLCDLENGTKGFATREHVTSKFNLFIGMHYVMPSMS